MYLEHTWVYTPELSSSHTESHIQAVQALSHVLNTEIDRIQSDGSYTGILAELEELLSEYAHVLGIPFGGNRTLHYTQGQTVIQKVK